MNIENGIKQPLRFYDTTDKQNFRREWSDDAGLEKEQVVICPENSIIPFQLRRKRSLNPIVLFDLYSYSSGDFYYDMDLFPLIPPPTTNHLSVVQLGWVDNIIWNPQLSFLSDISCGPHYVHLSDGVSNWYSEIFRTIKDFNDCEATPISIGTNAIGINDDYIIGWSSGGTDYELITSNKPF